MNKDNIIVGLVLGVIAPLFGMFGYYYWKFAHFLTLGEFFELLSVQKSLISGIVAICLLANVAIFTIYTNKRKDNTAKGIFIITCLYGIAAVLTKLFL